MVRGRAAAMWLAGGAVAGGVGGVAAAASPAVTLGALVGIAAITLGLARPKTFFALGLLAVLMQRTVELHVGAGLVGYLDEGFVLLCAVLFFTRRVLSRRRLRGIPGGYLLVAFLALGALSSVVQAVPPGVAAQGLLLIAKGFILALAAAQLDWTTEDLARMAKIAAAVAIVLIAGAAVNLAAPGLWSDVVLAGQSYRERFGLSPVTSFFQHPGYFGTVMALACIGAIAHATVFGRSKTSMFIIAGSIAAAFLTARRKILVGLLAAVSVLAVRLRWTWMLVSALVLLPIAAILAWESVASIVVYTYDEYFTNPDAVARVRLTVDAVALTGASFPLGMGFGRFGSAIARQEYSPLYYELGYQGVWGLGPTEESGQFLTDTFWPAIIGETGWIGAIAFVGILASIFIASLRLSRGSEPWDRWMGLVGMAWTVQLSVESIAGAVFTAVPTFALFFAVVGIMAARATPEPAGPLPRREFAAAASRA